MECYNMRIYYLYLMKILYFTLFVLFFTSNAFAQGEQLYQNEERKAINDLFLHFVDTSYNYHYHLHKLEVDTGNYQKILALPKDSNNAVFLSYFLQDFYPFDLFNEILKTNGEKEKLDNLNFRYKSLRDSLKKCLDTRELEVEINNYLIEIDFKMENGSFLVKTDFLPYYSDIKGLHRFAKKLSNKKLNGRYFNFDSINHGRYNLTSYYPEPIDYKKVKYICSIKYSRILFDSKFKTGLFCLSHFDSPVSGYGNYYLIKKKKGKWTIKKKYRGWIT
jgi:hypothetical protein